MIAHESYEDDRRASRGTRWAQRGDCSHRTACSGTRETAGACASLDDCGETPWPASGEQEQAEGVVQKARLPRVIFSRWLAASPSVSFQDRQGGEWYCVVDGRTLFEAVGNAMRFFADDDWRGPKPGADEVFSVALVGDERKWRVRGDRVVNFRNGS